VIYFDIINILYTSRLDISFYIFFLIILIQNNLGILSELIESIEVNDHATIVV